eukprot:438461-Prymnesium_polylepis.1
MCGFDCHVSRCISSWLRRKAAVRRPPGAVNSAPPFLVQMLCSDANFPMRLAIRRPQFVFLEKLEAMKASFASHRDAPTPSPAVAG